MKKRILIPSTLILITAALLAFALPGNSGANAANLSMPVNAPTTVVKNSSETTTIYSDQADKIKLKLEGVTATRNLLTLHLSISGLELSTGPDGNFESLVCVPFVTSSQPVTRVFVHQEVALGDPTQVTYEYSLSDNTYDALDLTIDWTIGPCDPSFDESNVTPAPQPLLMNSRFTYKVPVE